MFTFDQTSIDYRRHPFLTFGVFELQGPKVNQTVWLIEAKDNQALDRKIDSITYGVLPDGFTEKIAPRRLKNGRSYLVGLSEVIRKESNSKYSVIPYTDYVKSESQRLE
ncbi:MAG TPA: hypothetical protein V6C81_30975 [Planktothrix sp.]